MNTGTAKLQIFYDGGCKVCDWEVKKYLAMDTRGALGTIDINLPAFRAESYGLDRVAVRKYFHVLTKDGKITAGVDAFIAIWFALDRPGSRFAARWARFPPIYWVMRLGYSIFIWIRPMLPRNAPVCTHDSCSIE